MKKVVVTLLMVVVAQLAMAQDIIFKKYEDAKGVRSEEHTSELQSQR